ncbi:MAG: acyltransferase family protein [Pseudobdellovibrionaceae bacterium]
MSTREDTPPVLRGHYLVLDSFRGLCAALVAISHIHALSLISNTRFFDAGSVYVDFFFVLSGFVIYANYGQKLQEGYSLKKFMWLRFWRLYPLHFAVLMAFILSDVAQYFIHIEGAALYPPFSAPNEGLWAIFCNLLLIQSLHTMDGLSFNGPSWSISVEFYTYLIVAVLLSLAKKKSDIILIGVAIASVILVMMMRGNLYAKIDWGLFRCLYGFCIGCLTYKIYRYVDGKSWFLPKWAVHLLELLTLGGICVFIEYYSTGLLSSILPLLFSVVIVVFAFEAGFVSRVLKARPFLILGMLSYSIYMIHIFVSGKFFALPIRLIEGRTDLVLSSQLNGETVYGTSLLSGTLIEVAFLAIVIAGAFVSYYLIEKPFRNWSRKIKVD